VAQMALKSTVRLPVRVAENHTTALATHVSNMLRRALDAFARLSVDAAVRVMLANKDSMEDYDAGMRLLEAAIRDNPATLKSCMDQIWALRSLDRIGDHASNIAEQIVYLVTGSDVRHMDEATLLNLLDVSTDS